MAKSFFNTGLLGAAGSSAPSDDQFNRVSFLSHFDGSNNGVNNAFDDSSSSNHTITANGNVTQGSFGPFARPDGAWGWDFDSSAEGLVLDYGSTSHNYWNGNFTFEFWINTTDASSLNVLFGCWADNFMSDGSYSIGFSANGKINVSNRQSSAGNGGAFITCATATNDGAWHHIAITQVDDGGSTKYSRIFVDGVLDAYDTETAWTQAASNQEITIGGLSIIASSYESARRYTGLISNWRIVESIVYSTASTTIGATIFTPPTGPLTAISNTRILTCQSNRFVDNSSNGYGVASNGNGKTTAFGPFLTDAVYDPAVNGASAYFDGTGDYLTLPPQSDFAFGTGDFSVSLWVYFNEAENFDYLIDGRNSGQTTDTWSLSINFTNGAANKLMFASIPSGGSATAVLTSDTDFVTGQWYYISVSRSGTTSRMHFNGTQVAINSSDSTNYSTAPNTSYIGTRYSIQQYFDGYMCDVRVVKGTALSSYTPPTAPLTAITNTSLLLNMADGQAIDSTAQNNLTLVGNANTSTDQAKFGDTSLHLDGTGDYVIKYAQDISGTGAFTVEMFLRLAAVGAVQVFYDTRPSGTNGLYPVLFVNSDNTLNYYVSSGNRITSSETLSANTWYHIALCRSGTSTKLFLNGTQVGSTYSDSHNYVDSGQTYLGRSSFGDEFPTNCFIDEIRFSNMARYTSNFTAPTEPFADKGQ